MLPTVSKFLCCCPLRVGVLIIGWFQVIVGLTVIAALSYFLSNPGDFPNSDTDLFSNKEVAIKYFIICIFTLIFGCLLLAAVYKERSSFMRPWIILQIVKVSIELVSLIIGFAYLWYYIFTGANVAQIVEDMFYDLLDFTISLYVLVVVDSHYKQLTQSEYHPILSTRTV
ncbi:hypothetical protein ACFFRR_000170 [Megaselia abdita]